MGWQGSLVSTSPYLSASNSIQHCKIGKIRTHNHTEHCHLVKEIDNILLHDIGE